MSSNRTVAFYHITLHLVISDKFSRVSWARLGPDLYLPGPLSNPNDINPLSPWLHSTERCERVFCEGRRVVTKKRIWTCSSNL